MCGITGIYAKSSFQTMEQSIRTIMKEIAHRGPDGEGVYISNHNRIAFGHKRLAIIDPTQATQPMAFIERGLSITFNGCIYNYIELRNELETHGYSFKTSGDTEVILKAYAKWGSHCVHKFNGIWAFAIWDDNEKILFCSRDRLGVKPLYYYKNDEFFIFCSEIKGILKSGIPKASLNYSALGSYLTYQFYIGDETLFKDIFQLEPGYNLYIKDNELRFERYWEFENILEEDIHENQAIETLQQLLEDSIRLNLRSDVAVGAYLSGGLDSSSIVCLAKKIAPELQMKLFTGAFNEGEMYDETRHATHIAYKTGFENFIHYFTAGDFIKNISKIIWHMDQPQAGPGVFPQYMISKYAAEHVKVVLGGQGGDEIFVGYIRYLILAVSEILILKAHYDEDLKKEILTNPFVKGYDDYFFRFIKQSYTGKLEFPNNYFYLIFRNSSLQQSNSENKNYTKFISLFNETKASALKRALVFDIKTHLRALLSLEDRISMAFGLESRVPLLDHRLVEFMMKLPMHVLFKNNEPKSLFKQAVSPLLSPEILNRKDKMGFPVPLNKWAKNELKEFITDTLMTKKCLERGIITKNDLLSLLNNQTNFSRDLWGILSLELWFQQFIDNT